MAGTAWRRGKKNQGPKAKARRQGALKRLILQVNDFKDEVIKKGDVRGERTISPLYSEPQKKRINKEIGILETRV